jgi:hypothetical protein
MGGKLMVYKVLGCRDFITLLLFYTIGGHHKQRDSALVVGVVCGILLLQHTQLEGDSSIHRLRYYSPPKSQSMAMDTTKYLLSY